MARKDLSVLGALERDLKRFGPLADGVLAASARELARQLDDPDNSATSKSLCARALAETLERLRELAPPQKEADRLDELSDRRDRRRDAAAKSQPAS